VALKKKHTSTEGYMPVQALQEKPCQYGTVGRWHVPLQSHPCIVTNRHQLIKLGFTVAG
jgi:hypothetical protein